MNLAEFSIRKKTTTLVLTACLLIGGALSFMGMPRLEDPEFIIKEALVTTNYPGATPAEVADEVTDVIESAAQQMGQLDTVTSVNNPGQSIVTVEVQDTYDKNTLPQVWDELRRKVNDAQGDLPPGAGPSLIIDDFSDVYGILLAVSGTDYSRQDIQDFADYLRKQLLLVDGVAKITIWGSQPEQVFVEISRARMKRMGLSMQSVYDALSQRNLAVPSGNVRVGREYVEISPTGTIQDVDDLGDLLIKDAASGNMVPLRDLADIRRGYPAPPSQIMRYKSKDAIALGISMVSSGNVVDLGHAVDAKLQELKSQTPLGMHVDKVYYQPTRVDNAVASFVINLAEAVAIVIVVLLLFMGMQSGMLIGGVLLITICGSFIFIDMAGVALERVSLGALIIALGMLVDNAIVVTEGVLIRYQQGMDRLQAAADIVSQNKWPLLGSTVVAILAFAGIGLSKDATGEICRSLFIVLCISLLMSWITAMTITPLLCDMFLKPKVTADKDPYGGTIYSSYRRFLVFCLNHRGMTMISLAIMLAASVYGFGFVGQAFFPDSTQPRFYIHYWMPQGTDIRATNADIAEIEKMLLDDKRITSVASFAGEGGPRFILTYTPEKPNSAYGMLLVEVKDYHQVDTILAEYREKIEARYPDAEPKFKKFRLGPSCESFIEVRFSGPDTKELRQLSLKAQEIMRASGNARCVRDDWRQQEKIIRPVMAEAQAKLAGVTRPGLAEAMELFFDGRTVGVYREGDKLLPVVVRPPEKERSVQELNNVQVFSPVAGRMVPVDELVSEFRTDMRFGTLKTRNRMLTITTSCDPVKGLPSDLLKELRPQIEAMKLPPGYIMEWGGEYEDSRDAQMSLAACLGVPYIIMILVTIMLFDNLRNPAIIWLTVPLAIIGVTFGLLVCNASFTFLALLGFLSLSGMLIKNAVVLLDQIRLEMESGKEPYQAVVDSAVSRIRPVAMAAATTILGMIPLIFDAFFASMAVTIMFGLTFATILTLIVVPVLYATFYNVKNPVPV